jgi:hypothetical protein
MSDNGASDPIIAPRGQATRWRHCDGPRELVAITAPCGRAARWPSLFHRLTEQLGHALRALRTRLLAKQQVKLGNAVRGVPIGLLAKEWWQAVPVPDFLGPNGCVSPQRFCNRPGSMSILRELWQQIGTHDIAQWSHNNSACINTVRTASSCKSGG